MKTIHNVQQGTKAWHELRANYFTASEAAAMLGLSKYQSRTELLHAKATGEVKEISEFQQNIFDKGHAAEESARVIAEREIGEELYPATITNEIEGLKLLASMDGIDMLEQHGWECKLWNDELAAAVESEKIPDTHWPQLEHQMLVSECSAITFSVTDGTEDKYVSTIYISNEKRRKQTIAAWKQFAEDLANYVPEDKAEKLDAEPVRALPAISYKMDGLSLTSNLDSFKLAATDLVTKANELIETDQDFANAESRQKVFTKAEKDIDGLCERVLGEVASIDSFVKDLNFIKEQIRQARLAEGKQIKSRKEQIRCEILSDAQAKADAFRHNRNLEVKAFLPTPSISIADEMKGKKSVDSLKDAADTAVSKIKIEANEQADIAKTNIETLKEFASDHKFLFNDWKDIAFKGNDDFTALVKTRIAEHKEQEEKRLEAERERIRAEEQEKAQREAEAKAKREQDELAKEQREAETAQVEEVKSEPQAEYLVKPRPKFVGAQAAHAKKESESTQVKRELTEYQKGYIDGLQAFAHWKDGAQYVGTNGKTLNNAIEQFLQEQAA